MNLMYVFIYLNCIQETGKPLFNLNKGHPHTAWSDTVPPAGLYVALRTDFQGLELSESSGDGALFISLIQ